MKVYAQRTAVYYDLENLIAIFVQKSQLSFSSDVVSQNQLLNREDDVLVIEASETEIVLSFYPSGDSPEIIRRLKSEDLAYNKRALKKALYEILAQYYEPQSPWGILVGIRPVKIVHELLDMGTALSEIESILKFDYLISDTKVALLMEIAQRERRHLYPIEPKKHSIYICIPFCPTRCLYCSFPSNDVRKKGKLMDPYVEKLVMEITYVAERIKSRGESVDCLYIGGGTPTALNEAQLERLLIGISTQFDLSKVLEFTVEAGRPDTVTPEKLRLMKQYGVDRICVNPQTMKDETLVTIGRDHNAEAIRKMMAMVKAYGFKTVNMDLILGLPGETTDDVIRTVDEVVGLAPENVTLHTLAVKRASRLNENLEAVELAHDAVVAEMMTAAELRLRAAGITPYYMYRQKKMIGHLENVGYAQKGHASLYNMRIMAERHTIIALGAGAVSKMCHPSENRFERVANFKGVEDYLNRFDEVLRKKDEAFEQLDQ